MESHFVGDLDLDLLERQSVLDSQFASATLISVNSTAHVPDPCQGKPQAAETASARATLSRGGNPIPSTQSRMAMNSSTAVHGRKTSVLRAVKRQTDTQLSMGVDSQRERRPCLTEKKQQSSQANDGWLATSYIA